MALVVCVINKPIGKAMIPIELNRYKITPTPNSSENKLDAT